MSIEVNRHQVGHLLNAGAQLVDVLDKGEFDDSHLPGAVHLPLADLPMEARRRLDPARPTIVYCYDALCDLGPRAAARLESLGFAEVYDYVASKVDWMGAGLPFEGRRAEGDRLATVVDDAPTCGLDDSIATVRSRLNGAPLAVVVQSRSAGRGVVLGVVPAAELEPCDGPIGELLDEAPRTFRPHLTIDELFDDHEHLPSTIVVTNLDGTFVGVADREALRLRRSTRH